MTETELLESVNYILCDPGDPCAYDNTCRNHRRIQDVLRHIATVRNAATSLLDEAVTVAIDESELTHSQGPCAACRRIIAAIERLKEKL